MALERPNVVSFLGARRGVDFVSNHALDPGVALADCCRARLSCSIVELMSRGIEGSCTL